MRSTTLLPLTVLVMVIDFAIALPSSYERSVAARKIMAPTLVGLYVCTDAEWQGECEELQRGPGLCINLPEKYAGKVSSVGPDSTISGCTLFEKESCQGTELSGLTKPGESNLGVTPQAGKFNDFFHSYICY